MGGRLHRRGRRDAPIVALAGYTNAGKSTLFNRFTRADVPVEDKLFATLDSRLRKGSIGGATSVIFGDTGGFIRKLPHHLVVSFRSTLKEISQADLVLHVVDRSQPKWHEQMELGEKVLADLGVDMSRVSLVFNKTDRCGSVSGGLAVSAKTGAGIDTLKTYLLDRIGANNRRSIGV